jgi:hypothetical protein
MMDNGRRGWIGTASEFGAHPALQRMRHDAGREVLC